MNFEHLRALAAVVDEGTFEAAADRLHLSPSAVSQRIKALEKSVGQVVVRRTVPCTPTHAGSALLRLARQVQLLEAEARHALGSETSAVTSTPVAVNADSLATWFLPVLEEAAGWPDTTLDLHVEDQDHSSRLLRQGDVLGAVTADPAPVNGCRAVRLGAMRYVPAAAPALRDRFVGASGPDWSAMPVLAFNTKDDLQRRFLASRGGAGQPPMHTIPSSEAFVAAVRAGLGWGMVPELQVGSDFDDGRLVLLDPAAHHDVVLYWQSWTLQSGRLDRLAAAVRRAGRLLRS
ncbi:LysR family transcriptional regulator ArgP [Arthrobacter jiangjiafuii]|uniref:HTH-type transcriptional regulator LysG n=1 Tax=Arthrobacter jiangjiafuii TaxID=2817475 RepID=A0A975M5J6_9MICC|nr:LysR family transcriptional regulator ArgP [Arthrobacter jiangjiafuii]MBP3044784.1 LysR family transcriptional regulator ArgP [Arthrobacter jiangjiafuii]QWC10388.1 LysR family transcriptional regulator ArgP [Arthrobacter jiangjiafuii]